jgi:SAM-dependent methyltransferase
VGRLGLAVAPLIGERGSYLGIDVSAKDIETARRLFTGHSRFSFAHLAHSNRTYAPDQARAFPPYPIADASVDIVTAQSVWTHLNEADAMFYFGELARTLRPAGKAIVTFFYLDDGYRESLTVQPIGSAPPGSEPQKK